MGAPPAHRLPWEAAVRRVVTIVSGVFVSSIYSSRRKCPTNNFSSDAATDTFIKNAFFAISQNEDVTTAQAIAALAAGKSADAASIAMHRDCPSCIFGFADRSVLKAYERDFVELLHLPAETLWRTREGIAVKGEYERVQREPLGVPPPVQLDHAALLTTLSRAASRAAQDTTTRALLQKIVAPYKIVFGSRELKGLPQALLTSDAAITASRSTAAAVVELDRFSRASFATIERQQRELLDLAEKQKRQREQQEKAIEFDRGVAELRAGIALFQRVRWCESSEPPCRA